LISPSRTVGKGAPGLLYLKGISAGDFEEALAALAPVQETVRWLREVLGGPERRRRWSVEQKQAIVAAAFGPGAVVRIPAR